LELCGESFDDVLSLTPVGLTLLLILAYTRGGEEAIRAAALDSDIDSDIDSDRENLWGWDSDSMTAADEAQRAKAAIMSSSNKEKRVQVCDGLRKTLSLLLRHGADPNLLDGNGRPPLAYALLLDPPHEEEVCAELMQAGADPGLLAKAIEGNPGEPCALLWERGMAKLQQMQLLGEFALTKGPVVGTTSAVAAAAVIPEMVLISDGHAALGPHVPLPPVVGGFVGGRAALPMMGGTEMSPVVAAPPQADHSF